MAGVAGVLKAPYSAREISRPFIGSPSSPKHRLPQLIATVLRSWTIATLRSPSTLDTNGKIRIVCISDTHNSTPPLPSGDILLHAGDLSQYGLFDEIQAQLHWLHAQPHQHKIVIAGNHDLSLDDTFAATHPDRELKRPGKSRGDLDWGDIRYLHNSVVDITCHGRTLKVYGSPLTPKCGSFGFQYDPDQDVWADTVPDHTDILLAHGPPAAHLDLGKGCRHLLKELWRARPRLLVCGHIHDGRGEETVVFDRVQARYEDVLLGVRPWRNVFWLLLHTIARVLGRVRCS